MRKLNLITNSQYSCFLKINVMRTEIYLFKLRENNFTALLLNYAHST